MPNQTKSISPLGLGKDLGFSRGIKPNQTKPYQTILTPYQTIPNQTHTDPRKLTQIRTNSRSEASNQTKPNPTKSYSHHTKLYQTKLTQICANSRRVVQTLADLHNIFINKSFFYLFLFTVHIIELFHGIFQYLLLCLQ